MNNLYLAVQTLQARLNKAGIASITIGGVAIAIWGEPRVTRDIDLKVMLGREQAGRLIAILAPDYVSLLPDPIAALQRQAMLFVQDEAGTRLDLLLAETPYDVTAIQRGRDVEVQPGLSIRLCSPEDLIIYKLISTRLRDHEDASSVIRRQDALLDDAYILGWLRQFEQALDDSTLVAEYKRFRRTHTRG
ncbi:MAG: hypothetical protein MUC51_00635 [Anaerolineae bacterium]|jgi:hypothetical protein|nr:hypothetical protein [Anaerolineae bacterium]